MTHPIFPPKDGNFSPEKAAADNTAPRVDIRFDDKQGKKTDLLVLSVFDGGKLGRDGKKLDKKFNGWLRHALNNGGSFAGKRGQTLDVITPPGSAYKRIIMLGAGDAAVLDAQSCQLLGGTLHKKLAALGVARADVIVDSRKTMTLDVAAAAAHLADGMAIESYAFDKYKTDKKGAGAPRVTFVSDNAKDAAALYEPLANVTKGVSWARDLVSEPANALYPENYAERIRDTLTPLGVTVRIIDEKEMAELGMGAALAVAQGSARPARVVVMEYDGLNGKDQKRKPVALVGKGVTFDTGGISLKPGANMDAMKGDMGGSAAVVGGIYALAANKVAEKVVGVVGLVENMPSGTAMLPSAILTSMSGKTIEVDNTDAEGRLVLVDAMTYAQKFHKPRIMLDFATLTGAKIAALGRSRAALLTRDDGLYGKLQKAARASGERVWQLPLDDEHVSAMTGHVADLDNMGFYGSCGTSTAAAFLSRFVEKGTKWAHFDMAGQELDGRSRGTGWGARLIDAFVKAEAGARAKRCGKKAAPKPAL